MKQLEKPAIIVMVLYFVASVTSHVGSYAPVLFLSSGWSFLQITMLTVPVAIVSLAVYIALAIWLYHVAKREKLTPWVWAMFGLIFGVSGAILFFAVRVYEMLKAREVSEQHGGMAGTEGE